MTIGEHGQNTNRLCIMSRSPATPGHRSVSSVARTLRLKQEEIEEFEREHPGIELKPLPPRVSDVLGATVTVAELRSLCDEAWSSISSKVQSREREILENIQSMQGDDDGEQNGSNDDRMPSPIGGKKSAGIEEPKNLKDDDEEAALRAMLENLTSAAREEAIPSTSPTSAKGRAHTNEQEGRLPSTKTSAPVTPGTRMLQRYRRRIELEKKARENAEKRKRQLTARRRGTSRPTV